MPEAGRYDAGTMSWVDLEASQSADSVRFYRSLFGWFSYTVNLHLINDYEIFTLDERNELGVAGLHYLDGTEDPVWMCYIRVDDLDASVERVRAAGGQVLVDPLDASGLGWVAVCGDPAGAVFSLHQPADIDDVEVAADEPFTLRRGVLASADPEAAERFYGEVFGWQAEHRPDGVIEWRLGSASVALMVQKDGDRPLNWIPYFQVPDADATARQAADLGGHATMGPLDTPEGRRYVLTDRTGAHFGIITPDNYKTPESPEHADSAHPTPHHRGLRSRLGLGT